MEKKVREKFGVTDLLFICLKHTYIVNIINIQKII